MKHGGGIARISAGLFVVHLLPMDLQETMGKPLGLALLKGGCQTSRCKQHFVWGRRNPPWNPRTRRLYIAPLRHAWRLLFDVSRYGCQLATRRTGDRDSLLFRGACGGWYETQPGVDLMWAMILQANTTTNPGGSVTVSATFKNWSESATRHGSITVGWHLPH